MTQKRASRPPSPVRVTIDGAARGNPGPAAYGVVFRDAKGKELARLGARIGRATNNAAEYRALLAALTHAQEQGWRVLAVRTDSELLARQLEGSYKVRHPELKALHEEVREQLTGFERVTVEAVPRRLTREADRLANAALDGRLSVTRGSRPACGPKPSGGRRPVTRGGGARKSASSRVAPAPGTLHVHAVYENGVLTPLEKLELAPGEEVDLIIHRKTVGTADERR